MERMCKIKRCDSYRGSDIGYCHKLKVILNTEMKKEFFAGQCDGMDLEGMNRAWHDRMVL